MDCYSAHFEQCLKDRRSLWTCLAAKKTESSFNVVYFLLMHVLYILYYILI